MNSLLQALGAIDTVLQSFQSVSLEHLKKKAPLLNRRDEKFVFSVQQLPELLKDIMDMYYIIEVNHQRRITYNTVYYDTPGLLFYNDHLRGRSPRFKVRHRTYGNNETYSIEIKKKISGSRTMKYRNIIQTPPEYTQLPDYRDFFNQCTIPDPAELIPQTTVQYQRITLLHKAKEEKITIDIALSCNDGTKITHFEQLVIAEIKTAGASKSNVRQLLKKRRIYPGGISKYCLAMVSSYPGIKFNTFKPILKKIKKLISNDLHAAN